MRLQQKFGILFGLLGLTVAVNLAVAIWAVGLLERELAWPLESIQQVMAELHEVSRGVEAQAEAAGLVYPGAADPAVPAADDMASLFEQGADRTARALDRLAALPTAHARSGVSTTFNLQERAVEIRKLGSEWLAAGSPETHEQLAGQLWALDELVSRIEERIIADASLAVDFGQRLRVLVLTLVAATVLGVLLSAVLAVNLMRRWVLRPVASLRVAAERIGAGDLEHRVVVRGGDELADLAGEVNRMAELIGTMQDERVERERLAAIGEMTRRIVHNLRKPLSGIRGLAETTQRELPPESDLVGVQDRIIRSVDRFESWLRGILAASTPLTVRPEPVNPAEWLDGVIDSQRPAAEAAGIEVILDTASAPASVHIDPAHLEQAVVAVVTNAIEHAPQGSAVRVSAGPADEPGWWKLTVADSGPGVPADLVEAVFRPYFSTRSGGTGIGLALTKSILEQHGGRVQVLEGQNGSLPSSGAVFEFFLPIEPLANIGR